jgi:hypothetical protein
VDTTSGTTYSEPGTSVAPPGVQDGENVAVTLDPTASSPTATNVLVFPERVSGRVTNVTGSTVSLSNKRGTDTLLVSPSTKYFQKGTTPTGVSDGEFVTAFGLPDASTPGELDAQVVAIFGPPPTPRPTPTTMPAPHPLPQPTPQTTAAIPGSHVAPQSQPAAPQAGAGWSHAAPSEAPPSHGSWDAPGQHGGSPGGQGFGGHR